MQERDWPRNSLFHLQFSDWSGKGIMEVRDGGDVPGIKNHGGCEESALVVDKICDNRFNDLLGMLDGRGWQRLQKSSPEAHFLD